MKKIRKGDKVQVIAGKCKGEIANVVAVLDDKVLLDGVNLVKKHVKANPQTGERGEIKEISKPVHRSNVMLIDPTTQKRSRVGIKTLADGKKVRIFKASQELVEDAK